MYANCLPHRYELAFGICGPDDHEHGVSMTGFNGTSTITSAQSCGISVSSLKILSQRLENAMYIPCGTDGAIVIIRDAVDKIMGDGSERLIWKEQNSLVEKLFPGIPESGSQIRFDLKGLPGTMVPTVSKLNNHLESWFAWLNPPRFGNGYRVHCHIGSPTILTIGSTVSVYGPNMPKEYGLNSGDLYLVSGECSATIGRK